MFNTIDKAISEQIKKGKRKFAIYPFGRNGVMVKDILNKRYGVQEAIIVDNKLCELNDEIYAFEEVKNYSEYTWLLTSSNPHINLEIYNDTKKVVSEELIVNIFEQKYMLYGNEYRALSKLSDSRWVEFCEPCREFLELVKKRKLEYRNIAIAEIGVCVGGSAVEICKILDNEDTYYCFDYEDRVDAVLHDLKMIPEVKCKLIGKPNSYKTFDSYNWELSKMLFKMRNDNQDGIFDVVYLDGAHSFAVDGLTCCLLKEMVMVGGYILFDDLFWKMSNVDSVWKEELKTQYTEEQMNDEQIRRVVNAFMINDDRFQEIYMGDTLNPYRAIYKRVR